jgi:hypothetical protein
MYMGSKMSSKPKTPLKMQSGESDGSEMQLEGRKGNADKGMEGKRAEARCDLGISDRPQMMEPKRSSFSTRSKSGNVMNKSSTTQDPSSQLCRPF